MYATLSMTIVAPTRMSPLYNTIRVDLKTQYCSPFHRIEIVTYVLIFGNLRVGMEVEKVNIFPTMPRSSSTGPTTMELALGAPC